MEKRNWLLVVLLPLLMAGCKTSSVITVKKLSDVSELKEKSLIYALPQTTLKVDVTLNRTVFVPGPYSRFADDLLGIQNIPVKETVKWEITDADITSYEDSDPAQYYLVSFKKGVTDLGSLLTLNREGFVFNIADAKKFTRVFNVLNQEPQNEHVSFTDVTTQSNFTVKKDTLYKTVLQDSSFIKIPVFRDVINKKSPEDKALEAANFILDLRKQRYNLLTADYDLYPQGAAMQATLNEMNRLEQEYLSLFTGKRVMNTYHYSVEFIPDPDNQVKRTVLFRFSDSEGILSVNDKSGKPVMLEITKKDKTVPLDQYKVWQDNHRNTNILYYRVPDKARVRITDGEKTYAEMEFPVDQYGSVLSMPVNLGE